MFEEYVGKIFGIRFLGWVINLLEISFYFVVNLRKFIFVKLYFKFVWYLFRWVYVLSKLFVVIILSGVLDSFFTGVI